MVFVVDALVDVVVVVLTDVVVDLIVDVLVVVSRGVVEAALVVLGSFWSYELSSASLCSTLSSSSSLSLSTSSSLFESPGVAL